MQELDVKLRRWGRSIGVVIPKDTIDYENFKEGDSVTLLITKKNQTLRNLFGKHKFKESTDELLRELDEEGWDE